MSGVVLPDRLAAAHLASEYRRSTAQFDVSVNVATGCPSGHGPSAVTVTFPVPFGNVSVTVALPEESVVAIRLESVPPVVVNKMLAPCGVAPEIPTFNVAVNVSEEPVCASPTLRQRRRRIPYHDPSALRLLRAGVIRAGHGVVIEARRVSSCNRHRARRGGHIGLGQRDGNAAVRLLRIQRHCTRARNNLR